MDTDVAMFYAHGNPAKDRAAILLRRLEERPGRCVRQHENGRVTLHETDGGTLSTYAADALAALVDAGKLIRNDTPQSGYASWIPAGADPAPVPLALASRKAVPVETLVETLVEAPVEAPASDVDVALPAFGEGFTVADAAAWLDLSDKGASDWLRRQAGADGERSVREWYLNPKQPKKGIRFECCPALVEALEERGLTVSVGGVVMNGPDAPVPAGGAEADVVTEIALERTEEQIEQLVARVAEAPTVDLGLFGDGHIVTRPEADVETAGAMPGFVMLELGEGDVPPLIIYEADAEGNLAPRAADEDPEALEPDVAARFVRKFAAGLALALYRADVSIGELARRLAETAGGDARAYAGTLCDVLTHDPDVEIDLRLVAQIEETMGLHLVTLTDGAGERLDVALAGLRDRTIYAVQQDLQDAPDADAAAADAAGEADRIDAVLDHALAVVADCRWHLRPRNEREA